MAGLKEQVLNKEQMAHLKELGVDTSNASVVFIYKDAEGNEVDWEDVEIIDGEPFYIDFLDEKCQLYPAYHDAETGDYDHSYREDCGVFTLDDVLERLPTHVGDFDEEYSYRLKEQLNTVYMTVETYNSFVDGDEDKYEELYYSFRTNNETSSQNTRLMLAYDCLCWCAEHGLLKKN